MTKDYIGTGHQNPTRYDVHIEHGTECSSMRYKLDGVLVDYTWDGGGSGSTDLARALLWDVTGIEPEWRTYRLFKNELVAGWPKHVGECWRISDVEIKKWLAGVERDIALTETASQTAERQKQTVARDSRLARFARLLRGK